MTRSSLYFLHQAAEIMEKTNSASRFVDLVQTKKSFEDIKYWTWSEMLIALKQCQESPSLTNSSIMLKKCIDLLSQKISLADGASSSASSVNSSRFRSSCDSKSTESLKTNFASTTWWFEDLLFFSTECLEMFVQSMVSHEFDQVLLSKFLIHFQKSKFFNATSDVKMKVIESVIDMLDTLDENVLSLKALFDILRVTLGLNINKGSKNRLEAMIGSKLGHATLDNLLVPSPYGANYLYDVNLVLRLFKAFLSGGINQASPSQLAKAANLMDSYMVEVAPDPCLKSSKFLALAKVIPDSARKSYDEMYYAIDLYFEMHVGMSEEEKEKICCALNHKKLSYEVRIHLSKNPKFPLKSTPSSPESQQPETENLLQNINYSKSLISWPHNLTEGINTDEKEDKSSEQIVLYHGKFDLPADNERFKVHLEGMQWRVLELEKLCRKMQTQMRKILKSRVASSYCQVKSLPKLCS
ncbi:BTB/POZ domain-containing protein At3g22104 isoform X1 [Cucumis melo]|uniref:BTB/POZ domain-containing protein At3g22104 isoform X1 n=2 Tax=Cucumis melo TaxID=3656 RepID=A0A1S3C1I2_CUCME|nr:BTB/POZ domain-containing protein At3g22104 isoform X1 [Cucumis melo]